MRLQNRPETVRMLVVGAIAAISLVGSVGQARADCELPPCPINFDFSCPNVAELCGATFAGGGGCLSIGVLFCYSTGLNSYSVSTLNPLTITMSSDLVELEVFFASGGAAASGEMRFFNAQGQEVGMPIQTNGNCFLVMPPAQSRVFVEGVRTIEVTASGGTVWIDTLTATLAQTSPGPPDFDGNCEVRVPDLIQLLGAWGPCPEPCKPGDPAQTCAEDLDGNCEVRVPDLIVLLGAWGSV